MVLSVITLQQRCSPGDRANSFFCDGGTAVIDPSFGSCCSQQAATVDSSAKCAELLHSGDDATGLDQQLRNEVSVQQFLTQAPDFQANAVCITGVVCGVRVETVADPLMQKIRYLDKLIDELAKGRAMDKILRTSLK